jgi:protein-disulfide isomerase
MLTRLFKFVFAGLITVLSFSVHADPLVNALFHQANDPVVGNQKGKVTVVEFFDYQCMHCVNMANTIQTIVKQNPDVRVVFKEYPIRGPVSELASRAALAANMQGKYAVLNHALLTTDQTLDQNTIFSIAKAKGLNVQKLKKDMASKTVKDTIAANYALAKELGIAGTPAFFIGKTNATDTEQVNFVLGEMSESALQSAIQKSAA